jgi:hypothetical protein
MGGYEPNRLHDPKEESKAGFGGQTMIHLQEQFARAKHTDDFTHEPFHIGCRAKDQSFNHRIKMMVREGECLACSFNKCGVLGCSLIARAWGFTSTQVIDFTRCIS